MELDQLCQSHKWELQFSSSTREVKFTVESKEGNVSVSASATNISKKVAKRMVARQLVEHYKAQGYKTRSIKLEEILKKSETREAKLIGYDEMPSCDTAKSGGLRVIENSQSDFDAKVYRRNGSKIYSPATNISASSTVTAKSRLYEICADNCWKPPVFECCQETGPSHLKEFIFKIVLEMDEMPNGTFEFYGEPRVRKKDAAEHTAQGALWYLKQGGYING